MAVKWGRRLLAAAGLASATLLLAPPSARAEDESAPATAAAGPPPIEWSGEVRPGATRFGTAGRMEYQAGNLPIVLTASHGGRLTPEAIPDRTRGVRTIDTNTQELTRRLAGELHERTGRFPHVVISLLHRRKLDPNRPLEEAAQGNADAAQTWADFHAAIEDALRRAVAEHGFAFLVDVHGHGHRIHRLELGYALNAADLNQDDSELDAGDFAARSTLADLHERDGGPFSILLRGPGSLGDRYVQAGIRAIPSPTEPSPGREPFFAGGYIVRRHAAAPETTRVDGVQIECHFPGVRDNEANWNRFAEVTSDVLAGFLAERYAFTLPQAGAASAGVAR